AAARAGPPPAARPEGARPLPSATRRCAGRPAARGGLHPRPPGAGAALAVRPRRQRVLGDADRHGGTSRAAPRGAGRRRARPGVPRGGRGHRALPDRRRLPHPPPGAAGVGRDVETLPHGTLGSRTPTLYPLPPPRLPTPRSTPT